MVTKQNKTAKNKKQIKQSELPEGKDLETQMPLSEKDEVKIAEQRINKAARENKQQ